MENTSPGEGGDGQATGDEAQCDAEEIVETGLDNERSTTQEAGVIETYNQNSEHSTLITTHT